MQIKKEVFCLLLHKELVNPIASGEGIPDATFNKYIAIRDNQNEPILPELTAEVKRIFYASHQDVERTHLDKMWDFVRDHVRKNEALARFILDNDGAKSDFFFPWLMSVATSPSEALELSYNAGRNLAGEWIENIPEHDPINYFVRNLPTVAYNRERQLRVADLVLSERDMYDMNSRSKVVDLGAGRMAWARHHGFKFKSRLQTIFACDIDHTIKPDTLFSRPLMALGIQYRRQDLQSFLRNPLCQGASLAILQGVASYYPTSAFREAVVKPVYNMLRTDGNFFFDLQLDHISYEWSVKVFSWPEMKLPDTAAQAIAIVEAMRKTLWEAGMKFQAEYILDTYNPSPLSVMVLFTKL